MDAYWVAVVWALVPPALLAGLFWFVMRGIVRADRTERKTYARLEAQERARRGLPRPPAS